MTDLKKLIQSQRNFFASGKTRDLNLRVEQLVKLKDLLSANEHAITEALKLDLGKPLFESYFAEFSYVMSELNYVIKNTRKWAQPRRVSTPLVLMPAKSRLYSEPFGNILIIAPWNYPFQLTVAPLIGAIAAGNTAILKPSEITSHTQKLLVTLINENFAPEYIYCVGGGLSEAQALLEEKFDFIFFTGSTRVGRIVMEKAAKHLTPICLELGGKSPCIVDKDVDLKTAARRIIWGKFMNAGQTCVAPDYLCIHAEIYGAFLEQLKNTVKEFWGDNPQASSSLARIVNESHFDRLNSFIEKEKVVIGGETNRAAKFISPTILKNSNWTDAVMEDEVFGPILPTISYSSPDDLIPEINRRPKPLALYIFTNDKYLQERVLTTMPFGGACVNDCVVHLGNPNLPFGGIGESGMGTYHGQQSFELFSHRKSVLKKPFFLDSTVRYPPYTNAKLKLLRFLLG